jgi:hypothetical protein
MKGKVSSIVLILAITLTLVGCVVGINGQFVRGSGKVVQEEGEVSGIQRVHLSTMGDLTVSMGDQEMLVIEAEDNILPYLTSTVRMGTLELGTEPNVSLSTTKPVRYSLIVKELDGLSVSSSGGIQTSAINSGRFKINSSSSGDIYIASLTANQLDVSISSSGNVTIAGGEVAGQTINVSSSGNYTAPDLMSQKASVNLSSSGEATLRADETITGSLSSSGDLNYYGNPTVNVNTSSSGRVKKAGD